MRTWPRRVQVYVTGIGMQTPLGGRKETWSALLAGRSGISRFSDGSDWSARVGVAGFLEMPADARRSFPTKGHWAAFTAASEALTDAGLSPEDRATTDFVVGNNGTEMNYDAKLAMLERLRGPFEPDDPRSPHSLEFGLAWLRDLLGLTGVAPTFATNCVAGVQSIYLGAAWIAQGLAKRVVVGGVDCAVTAEMASRFLSLRALASPARLDSSRPFDARRHGFVLADGAGFLVLESESSCEKRGARPYGQLSGWGLSNDACHLTRGSPSPAPKLRAMTRALQVAGLAPEDIVLIDAHGTSTQDNDIKEFQAWQALLGARIQDVLITAAKSALGHSLAAAGAIETGLSFLMLRHGVAPPIQNLEEVDKECRVGAFAHKATSFVPGPILKTTFAFGGLNACGIFSPS